LRRRVLALADAGAAIAVSASFAVSGPGVRAAAAALLFAPAWVLAGKLYGLYDRDHRTLRHLTVDDLPSLLAWGITSSAALVVFCQVTSLAHLGAVSAVRAFAIAVTTALLLRSLARLGWRHLTPPERVMVVGSDPLTHSIRRKLELFSDIHASVVSERRALTRELLGDDSHALPSIDRLVLAAQSIDEHLIAELVSVCRRRQVKLSVVPPARGLFGTAVQLHHVADLPLVEYSTWDVSRSTLLLKRAFDLALAVPLLALAAPLFLAIVVAIRLGGGPAFYTQTRVGLGGREFRIFKFRTMQTDAEAMLARLVEFDALPDPVFKLCADPRVTRLGRLLRRTSLDELPQLVNVLIGDMSLVGPRPEQVELVRRYRPEHLFRLSVKPGLTGPMQVFGRGRLSFEERLAVEREYIENLSLSRDLRILALTIPSVLAGRGAY
jgi:exopolysaccharide biosynthesis polyprenyl glycosylphosphotransferase